MKNNPNSKSGVALVIVLGFLVIISALAVAFFSSVTTELKGARTFASGVTTRQLADSAANLVMAQIREATARENGAWASQPGMIRVFRDSTGSNPVASSKAEAFFKLYSSDVMVVQGQTNLKSFVSSPQLEYDANFADKPAFWTDLNAPVVVADPVTGVMTPHFPVIDPTAMGVVHGFSFDTTKVIGTSGSGNLSDRLPMPVKWIYVLRDGTFTVPDQGSGTVAKWSVTNDGRTPTKDNPIVGRIAFWADDDCSKVNINTAGGFVNTAAEVPAGYHGDDYFGSYWDTPRFYTNFDYGIPYEEPDPNAGLPQVGQASGGLALTQLLQGEYQRYPGHPATTSLGGIFGAYMSSHDLWRILPRISTENYNQSTSYASYSVNPYSYGTDGGTKRIVVGAAPGGNKANNQNMLPKSQRLYASVDELLFTSDPGGPNDPTQPSTYQRQTNDSRMEPGPARLTPQHLDKLRFFLTASSRAPELNLFGRPRISVWAVRSERNDETVTAATLATSRVSNITTTNSIKYYTSVTPQGPDYTPDGGTGLNAYDKVMLFCSTIGPQNLINAGVRTSEFGSPGSKYDPGTSTGLPGPLPFRYIFLRRNSHIVRDLDVPTVALPNFPTPKQEDRYADITLPRNRFLLETYLSLLTSQNIPGFADPTKTYKNLKAKLDSDGNKNRDALLVEIFDYVRCANMQDGTTLKYTGASDTSGDKNRMFAPRGLMAPSKIEFVDPTAPYNTAVFPAQGRGTSGTTTSTGMGRFPTISEATLVFYYAGPTWKKQTWIDKSVTPNKAYTLALPEVYPTGIPGGGFLEGVPKFRQLRAFLLLSTFNPMFGYAPLANPTNGEPKVSIEITGLENLKVSWQGQPQISLGFPAMAPDNNPLATTVYIPSGAHWSGRNMGGYEGFMHTLMGQYRFPKVWTNPGATRGDQLIAKCRKTFAKELEPAFFGRECIAAAYPTGAMTGINPANQPRQEYYPFQTSLLKAASVVAEAGKLDSSVTSYPPAGLYTDPLEQPDGVGLLIPTYTTGNPPLPIDKFNFHGNATGTPIVVRMFYDSESHYDLTAVGCSRNTRSAAQRGKPVQEIQLRFPSSTGSGWPVPKGDADDGSAFNAVTNPWSRANFYPSNYPIVSQANGNLYPYYWQWNGGLNPSYLRGSSTGGPSTIGPDTSTYGWFEFYGKPPYTATNIPKPLDFAVPSTPGGVTVPALPGPGNYGSSPGPWPSTVLKCGLEPAWSFASRVLWAGKNSEPLDRPSNTTAGSPEAPYNWYEYRFLNVVQPGDTVRSVQFCTPSSPTTLAATSSGDLRIGMTMEINDQFSPHPDYDSTVQRACGLRTGGGTRYLSESTLQNNLGSLNAALRSGGTWYGDLVEPDNEKPAGIFAGKFLQQDRAPANLPVSMPDPGSKATRGQKGGVQSVVRADGTNKTGDFDTGMGNHADGPYANKPDEGNVVFAWFDPINRVWHFPIPYFTYGWAYEAPGDTFTSPLRQMPSPAMIGSLPRRPVSKKHWETICLTPYPAGDGHPGNDFPRDHLLLDLFTMPIVEPYPISEPFSTAGKINMNYRIVPFDYITRSTAMRAAMAPIRVTGVPQDDYRKYKVGELDANGNARNPQVRLADNYRKLLDANKPINTAADLTVVSNTLQAFEDYFDAAKLQSDPDLGIFKSASQICEMPLFPQGESNIVNFWSKNKMTGDNVREKPYADLYPRLTTKSNTYTVHFRVQTLRQIPRNTSAGAAAYAVWEEGKDNVLGEYRGATTIERYIDPVDTRLNKWLPGTATLNKEFLNPDMTIYDPSQNPTVAGQAANPTRTLELLYRFRTVLNKKFAP